MLREHFYHVEYIFTVARQLRNCLKLKNIHYPPQGVDLSCEFPPGDAQTGLGTITIKPRLLSFLQGDAGQGGEMEPIVEDVRVYVRQYAAAFSLAV